MQVATDPSSAAMSLHSLPKEMQFLLLPLSYGRAQLVVELDCGLPRILHGNLQDWTGREGYEWSVVFSIAYLVTLGWSPIIRNLLGHKRRENRVIEKGEDGVRAQMIEEGINALVFSCAADNEYFQSKSRIPDFLLREVQRACSAYEVRCAGTEEWKQSIWLGYSLWRKVRKCNGGILRADLHTGKVSFRELPRASNLKNDRGVAADGAGIEPGEIAAASARYLPKQCKFVLTETKPNVAELFVPIAGASVVNIGSKAEEWSHVDEGFRWHDTMHIAQAVHIGWSPVMSALFQMNRDIDPSLIFEYGLRAQISEEAFNALVFQYFLDDGHTSSDFFRRRLEWYVDALFGHYRAPTKSAESWYDAILCGEAVWRHVSKESGGVLRANFAESELAFQSLEDCTF